MRTLFYTIALSLTLGVSAANSKTALKSLKGNGKAYRSESVSYAKRYCQVGGPFMNCSLAAEIAIGDAMSVCYLDGNSNCSVRLVRWIEMGGTCSQNNDYCHAEAIAVPYFVETQYIGNSKNAP